MIHTRVLRTLLAAAALSLAVPSHGTDTQRAGRYLDRTTLVHDGAQLNPLEQVADLDFSSRLTVGEALRSALAGTGYRLLEPGSHPHAESRALLASRVAMPHQTFDGKRVDSVISALVGEGRGYRIEIDHVARRIRIVPILPAPREGIDRPVMSAKSRYVVNAPFSASGDR